MHAGNLGDFLDIWPCYIQTLVLRISYISRLHPTTALVSFKPILHACREFGRFFRYLAMLHSNSGFENILHIQVTSNHCSCDFQTHLTGMEFGIPLGYFEEILCGHVTSKFLHIQVSTHLPCMGHAHSWHTLEKFWKSLTYSRYIWPNHCSSKLNPSYMNGIPFRDSGGS